MEVPTTRSTTSAFRLLWNQLMNSSSKATGPFIMESYPENKKLNWLRSQIIGGNAEFTSPFGERRITYADSTASGRSLHFIESYIFDNVLPFYGNTHTNDSYVGQRSTKIVDEAKGYIKRCLGGGEEDAILFCGSGSTAAIKRLQEVMAIAIPSTMRSRVLEVLRNEERWVVFVGPFEHHSNLLSWRQSLAQVVEIGLTEDSGSVDMEALRAQLEHYGATNRPMLGSFSACSNVTGIVTDTRALARLLHRYGAFACFDFASSGPYVEINMRSGENDGYDAVVMSPHKFIGGPGSPGILLMNRKLYQLTSSPPSTCGGGTVSYVNGSSEEDTLYSNNVEERENAGTPPILQTVRAALAFWVKEYIGYKAIERQEHDHMTRALAKLSNIKNIQILGNTTTTKRLPVLSFLIYPATTNNSTEKPLQNWGDTQEKLGTDKPLHGRFVAKLLSDLFGIQARGGCACAGPYGHYLLNVDKAYSLDLRSSIQKGYEGVKPGWTRICFPYYMVTEELEFALTAIEFVAAYGHRFLPLYNFNWLSGDWTFKKSTFKEGLEEKEICTSNIFDVSKLGSFLEHLRLKRRNNESNSKETKDVASAPKRRAKYTSVTCKYASYMETALYVASQLPNFPKERSVPQDLVIDLPFMI